MVFGYARVSTMEQSLDLQLDALLKEGIPQKNIYTDKVSSTKEARKSLSKLLKYVRDGDTIVVWKLDRLARSLIHFTNLMTRLKEKGVRFRSITEPFIDTTEKSSHSEFIINIFAALAQLERDIIIERTKAGLESARRRGKILGAPKGLSKKNQQKAVLCEEYFNNGVLTVTEICERLNISRATYYKYLRHRGLSGKLRSYKR
ncbi:recombinase family protein [Muricauda ruestringensis]|uniref:Recombinase family protein n=1 Tax=Flagellimonas aurea TaxID=2915619 RepID=A0ABS3G131_9FLAO|nr:recombinase family protein [Allomuricauda aurea]MBC71199.1 resolvase [Allomuricauda sp.]MBO0352764.1 recombinase family protein [Allomuricauda aurea]|tara:strand:+ start:4063 stop:4671 length:609 start_codon:yes stop_codon:yes gene_type:complete